MGPVQQVVRQLGILNALRNQPAGYTRNELATRFHRPKQTIARDLETLRRARIRILEDRGATPYVYRLAPGERSPVDLRVTSLELLALYAARARLGGIKGSGLFGDLELLLEKVQGAVDPDQRAALANVAKVFMAHPRGEKSNAQLGDTFEGLVNAILRRHVCIVVYRAMYADAPRTHELRPLKLFFHQGGLYVVGLLGKHRHVSTLAVERISSFVEEHRRFRAPRALDIEKRFESAFGVYDRGEPERVEVIFSRAAAPYVKEHVWHPSQVIDELPDGRLRWRGRVQGQYEVLAWVMSRGPEAELVRPLAWRRAIRESLARAVAGYEAAPRRSRDGTTSAAGRGKSR